MHYAGVLCDDTFGCYYWTWSNAAPGRYEDMTKKEIRYYTGKPVDFRTWVVLNYSSYRYVQRKRHPYLISTIEMRIL